MIKCDQGDGDTCETEQFRVLDDGTNQILDRGTYFCGKGPVSVESRTNFITFGICYLNFQNHISAHYILSLNFRSHIAIL